MTTKTHEDRLAKFGKAEEALVLEKDVPEYLREYKGQQQGRDNVEKDDILIPRLGLAQTGMSPQLKKLSEFFIPDLQPGQLFNTVTNEIYGTEVFVVPLIFFKQYIEFTPMNEGGGVKGMYADASEVPPEKLQFLGGVKPAVTEFKNRLCLLIREGHKPILIVVSFKSSGLKSAKKWNSLIQGTNLPAYARCYKLKVVDKVKGQQNWFGLDPEYDVFVPEHFFKTAEQFFIDMAKGGYRVDTSGLDHEESDREPGDDREEGREY